MARDWLKGVRDDYDVIVVGSGLAGLTSANSLAKCGHSVLLLEHHYQFGGLATWFRRPGGHIFDISLHGFPIGMIKSCRKYWTREIADSIVQLKGIRFVNPQFEIETTFDRQDFTRLLIEKFGISAETVEAFFTHLRGMNFYDDDKRTTRELFEEFFPGRDDVVRLLMEPIAYANGSTLDDPAITYGIVFSNFMSKGVFTFRGGTDVLIKKMVAELRQNGADLRRCALVERILIDEGPDGTRRISGVIANGRRIGCRAVMSNSGLRGTVLNLAGRENFDPAYVKSVENVRLNSSSCQVYIGLKPGESFEQIGDLIFTSESEKFSSRELVGLHTRSRTFSIYYPEIRPGKGRYTVVASLNGRYDEWSSLNDEEYEREKKRMIEESLNSLERFIPGIRSKVEHVEAATPRTIEHYTRHQTSFGTKFEGLGCSMDLPRQLPGLFHAGSVGIIMSGWLGSMNYGVIVSNKVDSYITSLRETSGSAAC
ncbi:MAG: phytoene dehydrogenase [Verrucomicrobia bacterium]|nr:MAG: phytoene dehydrogenase [Verrucomicrobiota bacterium]